MGTGGIYYMQWFDVDKQGLAKLLARKGKEFAIFELVQNAWDEQTSQVNITLERITGTRTVRLVVEDDNPEGFKNLSHAFTLFAESTKKGNAEKRGRFNLGEKLVLAMCEIAEVASTKGTILFDSEGRHNKRSKRDRGTTFTGIIRMTLEEEQRCAQAALQLIPPTNIETFFNGRKLTASSLVTTIDATLPTEIADDEGYLRKTQRKTTIEVFEPRTDEPAMIFEMGIPVVETGDKFHINVLQKVPLNLDRDNVTPAYLALVRSLVLDAVSTRLNTEDANATWVKDSMQTHGDDLAPDTINTIMDLRFGKNRVAFDPSDPEANKLAVARGYTVIAGNQMSRQEWAAAKRTGTVLPAGQVTPSPKPYSRDGKQMNIVPESKYTDEMRRVVAYIHGIAPRLIGTDVSITIANDIGWPFAATYGSRQLTLNLGRLGHKWFNWSNLTAINSLLIHEFGHHYSGDHLSSKFHDALCDLGAKLAALALSNPKLFS